MSPSPNLDEERPSTNLSNISNWSEYKNMVKEKQKNAEDAMMHFKLNSWYKKYKFQNEKAKKTKDQYYFGMGFEKPISVNPLDVKRGDDVRKIDQEQPKVVDEVFEGTDQS